MWIWIYICKAWNRQGAIWLSLRIEGAKGWSYCQIHCPNGFSKILYKKVTKSLGVTDVKNRFDLWCDVILMWCDLWCWEWFLADILMWLLMWCGDFLLVMWCDVDLMWCVMWLWCASALVWCDVMWCDVMLPRLMWCWCGVICDSDVILMWCDVIFKSW